MSLTNIRSVRGISLEILQPEETPDLNIKEIHAYSIDYKKEQKWGHGANLAKSSGSRKKIGKRVVVDDGKRNPLDVEFYQTYHYRSQPNLMQTHP